jgi:DNA (cytosine-5)-methyltransferase 1
MLPSAVFHLAEAVTARGCGCAAWGQYGEAIHRWEAILDRSAPEPTELSAKGNRALSPRAVEFMMGLPEGWVTQVPDLPRNPQLKALGNGVVPQQAAHALELLLPAYWAAVGTEPLERAA